jgi:hypothetical protein
MFNLCYVHLLLFMHSVASQGKLPSEELLQYVKSYIIPSSVLGSTVPPSLSNRPILSDQLRSSLESLISPQVNAFQSAGILPAFDQLLNVADQVPQLIQEVADGARDFVPSPPSVAAAARRAYRARRTLLIQYENDPIDETNLLKEYLIESERIMRIKRPMVQMDIEMVSIVGGPFSHATPTVAPPLELAEKAETILGDAAKERLLYLQVEQTVLKMLQWLEKVQ